MSLHQYEIDFAQLPPDEKSALINRIQEYTDSGLYMKTDFQSAIFFIDEKIDISYLKIPAECHLSRL